MLRPSFSLNLCRSRPQNTKQHTFNKFQTPNYKLSFPKFYSQDASNLKFSYSAEEIEERVLKVVKNFDKVDPSKVTPEAHFVQDLGLDSLDSVELVLAVEDEFAIEIPDEVADEISNVKKAVAYLVTQSSIK